MTNIISFIKNNWGLENITTPTVMQKNTEREVYLVSSREGSFILKIFQSKQAKKSILQYAGVLSFLTQAEIKYAPKIVKAISGDHIAYIQTSPAYLLEYIEGVELIENEEDEYRLGSLLGKLHGLKGCSLNSTIDTKRCVTDMLTKFNEYPFKAEYDTVVKSMPDFNKLKQSFIHTDICPTNAIKRSDGKIFLIDFDDAGIGSTYIDLGYPLISQFVQFVGRKAGEPVPDINKLEFHSDAARAFYDGYFSIVQMSTDEKRHIFDGAVFMQLLYMPVFGVEAIPFMWRILSFVIENKHLLLSTLGI